MIGALFEDPMRVPYWFADDDDTATAMVAEFVLAGELTFDERDHPHSPGLLATDTETDYVPDLDLNIEVAEGRVVSMFAAFRTTDGVSDEALITGDDVPQVLTDLGYVACKAYVIDLGYVSAHVLAPLSGLLLYVWNLRFERKVFEQLGVKPGFMLDLMLGQALLDLGAEGIRYYTGLARAADTYLGWNLEGKGGIQLSYRPIDVLPHLSPDQKAYAAQDAVATALIAPVITEACKQIVVDFDDGRGPQSLYDTLVIESGGSPFLDKMQVAGVPMASEGNLITIGDHTVSGWVEYCTKVREPACAHALARIADLEYELAPDNGTNHAAQGLLSFDEAADEVEVRYEPSFEPGSHKQLIPAINRLIPDQARAYNARHNRDGKARLFTESDTLDKNVLKLMDGELPEALREWSKHNKLITDSGVPFVEKWVNPDSGRLHPEIKQSLVRTGRLSMESPPMQNRPPELKRFHRPSNAQDVARLLELDEQGELLDEHGNVSDEALTLLSRVQVVLYADLSQAELRALAHMSQDERMLNAFRDGKDLHTLTATEMFELDIETMQQAEDLSDEDLVAVALANRVDIAWGHTKLEGELGEDRLLPHPDEPKRVISRVISRSKLVSQVVKDAKTARGKAKVPNFGVAYGMSGPTLARNLCLQGVDTTPEEGTAILNSWMDTYPGVKRWLLERDAYIDGLAANPPECDFDATWRLLRWHKPVTNAKFALKRSLDRFPTPTEIAEYLHPKGQVARELTEQLGRRPSSEELATEMQARTDFVRWVLSFTEPVVVLADGTPFAFASRTLGGRRRLFQISTKQWLASQVKVIVSSDKELPTKLRNEFGRRHRLKLSPDDGGSYDFWTAADRVPKPLHEDFVNHVLNGMHDAVGPDAGKRANVTDYLGRQALSDRIRALKQQYRNAPIQGTVGDVAMYAYRLLDQRLERFGDRIVPSLTVHDSVMLLSDLAVAREGAQILQQSMEEAMAHFCPSVPAKADAAILYSFAEDDPVDEVLLDAAEAAERALTRAA